ncbi:SNF2 domain-containing protein CLASSY 3 [Cynara cardunculus var. scolymus]|uniref:SNF2 domain-containing protein CLASSY 3 n=1 Tax=Cynara cardunculus var. scolymus TaxID=59895 RepID=UPI000D62F86A|nr:SNF2 domain-containing protein CLASSY 3 [Cynara cardunculus var. scolymus]
MSTISSSCIAKRTRLQRHLLLQEWCCGSSSDQSRKRNREIGVSEQEFDEVIDVDSYWIKKKRASKTVNGSGISFRLNIRLEKSIKSEEEESDKEESDGVEEIDDIEFPKIVTESNGYGSASSFKTGKHTYFFYSSDDSDSNDTIIVLDDIEDTDEDFQTFCKYHDRKQTDMKTCFYDRSTEEDEPSSFSESESDNSENWDFLLNKILNQSTSNTNTGLYQSTKDDERSSSIESENDNSHDSDFLPRVRKTNQPRNRKQSHKKNMEEKVLFGSVDRKEKNHSVPKAITKKMDKNPTHCSSDSDTKGKTNAKHKANGVKHRERKSKRVLQEENGGSIDVILDSIIRNGGIHGKEGDDDDDDYRLPLRFRFDDSEDESLNRKTDDSDVEGLFREMDFELECEEIGSYKTSTVENRGKDDYKGKNEEDIEPSHFELCQRGEHDDVYFEEQTGMRCGLCGAVILESRFAISKLANYAPDRSKRSYVSNEQQFSSSENLHFEASDWNLCEKTEGTFWDLIPTRIQTRLYPHQQEGLKFLWENLAGTVEISRLQKLDSRKGGGGCIISHAPGTGKTLLTIVFIESFLKTFPKCCPVIVAPASMLLTWEAEFKKWRMGFSFINLNNLDLLSNEMVNGDMKRKKDLIRAMKISSWSNGGSVLGVSYSLYEKLAGNAKNPNLEKMGNLLLDVPRLVVLDEGHTPRNQSSNIWNTLLKLKTKNRVILSGTPFQNNFRELFNTLRLVRPATAVGIENEKIFADMIQQKNGTKSRGCRSGSEDIEKLKTIISPFVHVHKGHILESKLPGLKQSVILLNPPPFQKRFIVNLENLSKTLEYEHKVALVSVHPSLLLHCSLSETEEKLTKTRELEKVRLHPDLGVKTRFVMELIRLSISLNEKVLIFSQYIPPLELLKDQIALTFAWEEGREIMIIKGKIHQKVRQTIINGFNDPNSKVKVLLASTKCCSEGIHLIGASRVILLDVVWNPSVERQAISRAYRLGQTKVVYTYHLMAAGTTEEEKYDRQVAKGRLAELVFSSSTSSSAMDDEQGGGMEVNDKILQEMMDHQQLKDMFKKIRYPEKEP